MRNGLVATGLKCLLLLLIATAALAQGGRKPLSVGDVEHLLKGGVTTARVATLVGQVGVDFEMTGATRARLERAGADADLIAVIERAAATRAPTKAPPAAEPERRAEPEPTEPPAQTALVVRTNVSGDDVQIDGRSVGASGARAHDVSPGRHTVVVRRDGYRTAERDVDVREGETKTVRLELTAIEAAASAPARPAESGSAEGMVSVPGGSFFMGCNEAVDSECDSDEKPGKMVDVAAFRIDKTEVTVADYRACVNAGRCSAAGLTTAYWSGSEQSEWSPYCNWNKAGKDDHPINCVTWDHAVVYCEWRGKRLPSEAEWEKAARGTDRRKYSWGNAGYGAAGRVANIADESAKRVISGWTSVEGYDDGYVSTAPVGTYPAGASPCGALDMIGNVGEWLRDPFLLARALRGGSWRSPPKYARASDRYGSHTGLRNPTSGFRCAQ